MDLPIANNSQTRASDATMIRKIGLLNHMGAGNLGDDATQDAVMQNVKRRWPDAEIVLFSMNPADTSSQARHTLVSNSNRIRVSRRTNANVDPQPTGRSRASYENVAQSFCSFTALNAQRLKSDAPSSTNHLFLIKSLLILRSLDLLIISGGGQLLDSWGGPWKFPYTIFKWTLLAKLSGEKCYFLNVGAGPLTYPSG